MMLSSFWRLFKSVLVPVLIPQVVHGVRFFAVNDIVDANGHTAGLASDGGHEFADSTNLGP